jgi:hypothetical protein
MCASTTSKNRASPSSVTSTWPSYYARINQAWTLSTTQVKELTVEEIAKTIGVICKTVYRHLLPSTT